MAISSIIPRKGNLAAKINELNPNINKYSSETKLAFLSHNEINEMRKQIGFTFEQLSYKSYKKVIWS